MVAFVIVVLHSLVACGSQVRDIHNLQSEQARQDSRLAVVEALLGSLQVQYDALLLVSTAVSTSASNNETAITALQTQIENVLLQISVLQGYSNIVSIIDPCGDAPGIIDEVLFKLSDGRVISSFSDNAAGQNTRFSVLPEGVQLSVTDGSHCTFKILNGNIAY